MKEMVHRETLLQDKLKKFVDEKNKFIDEKNELIDEKKKFVHEKQKFDEQKQQYTFSFIIIEVPPINFWAKIVHLPYKSCTFHGQTLSWWFHSCYLANVSCESAFMNDNV